MIAQIAETHRDPKKRSKPFDASEFHPMRETPKQKPVTFEQLEELL